MQPAGLKRCASVYQGLDKKIKLEPTTPTSIATELEDSPSHFELAPIAAVTPIKQEPMEYYEVHAFYEGIKRYNGYNCLFLKKPIKMGIFSSAMSITCNSSVAVFSMPRLIRARLSAKVDEVLDAGAAGPFENKKNPFTRSPVFLPIGRNARMFRQPSPGASAEAFAPEELKRGLYFHGRLCLEVLVEWRPQPIS